MGDWTSCSLSEHTNGQDSLEKYFGKREEVNWRTLHNKEFDKFYNSILLQWSNQEGCIGQKMMLVWRGQEIYTELWLGSHLESVNLRDGDC